MLIYVVYVFAIIGMFFTIVMAAMLLDELEQAAENRRRRRAMQAEDVTPLPVSSEKGRHEDYPWH